MFGCATRSITGPASPPSMTLKAIAAMSRYADAATRTVAPSAVSQTDCLAWLVSSCSDRRRLTRSLVSRPNNKPAAVRHALRPASVSRFGWSAVSPSRPADRHRATRSGGQDWPQATVRREAVLTGASTARGFDQVGSAVALLRPTVRRHPVRMRNDMLRGVTAPLTLLLP